MVIRAYDPDEKSRAARLPHKAARDGWKNFARHFRPLLTRPVDILSTVLKCRLRGSMALAPMKGTTMTAKLLRLPEVKEMTGLSTSTIYAAMSRGEFPKPIKLGARAVAWKVADISNWIDSRPVAA